MYCRKCGKEVNIEDTNCSNCGYYVKLNPREEDLNEPKTALGILMAILGVFGLIIGMFVFPANTIARKTFIKSWITATVTLWVSLVVIFLILLGITLIKN